MPLQPVAAGPLLARHQQAAEVAERGQWRVATAYPTVGTNRLFDYSHWDVCEFYAEERLASELAAVCGLLPDIGCWKAVGDWVTYRLTKQRAIVTGLSAASGGINVTGGWSALVMTGPNSRDVLSRVTALDLRADRFAVGHCLQGPVSGVNCLVARRDDDRYELHMCPDSCEFIWDVLLDAGAAFGLSPAGIDQDN